MTVKLNKFAFFSGPDKKCPDCVALVTKSVVTQMFLVLIFVLGH